MEVVTEKTNADFKGRYAELLDKYEVELQLFHMNLEFDGPLSVKNMRGGVYNDDGTLALIFLDANPFMLQLFGINNSLKANETLGNFLKENDCHIKGIMGNNADTDLYMKANNGSYFVRLMMDIMKLTKLNKIDNIKGRLIKPTMFDIELITRGIKEFTAEALHDDIDYGAALDMAKRRILNDSIYFFENEYGEITSMFGYEKRGKNGSEIGLVYTFKDYRGCGYAKKMINLACEKSLSENNSYVTLFVDKKNPISNRVYLDNGFVTICDMYEIYLRG